MSAKLVAYLATTRLGARGTLTLPKAYRDSLKLQTGAPITVLRIGDGLILVPEPTRFEKLCDAVATSLERAGITEAALQATLPRVRQELAAQRYPELFVAKKSKLVRSNCAPRGRKKG